MDHEKLSYFSAKYLDLSNDELIAIIEEKKPLLPEARLAVERALIRKGIDPKILERYSTSAAEVSVPPPTTPSVAKRVLYVLITGAIVSLPSAAINIFWSMQVAGWYGLILMIASALGGGLFCGFFGLITLIAKRDRPDRGLRTALVVTVIFGVLFTFVRWYGGRP